MANTEEKYHKKQSLFVLIFLSTLIVYTVVSVFISVADVQTGFHHINKDKVDNTLTYMQVGEALIQANQIKTLAMVFERAKKLRYFDFYQISQMGNPLPIPGSLPNNELFSYENLKFNEVIVYDGMTYAATEVDEFELIIGFYSSRSHSVLAFMDEIGPWIFADIAVVIIAFLLIVLIYLKDILQILNALRKGNLSSLSPSKAKSYESEILASSIQGMGLDRERLGDQNIKYRRQLMSAIRSELDSDSPSSLDFDCTLVRTDINRFSEYSSKYPQEELMDIVNRFFVQSGDIISRYGGYIYETVGDEIIFYFKEDEYEESFVTALSCVRDLNEIAEHINSKNKLGLDFKVKSALSFGKLRFRSLMEGFGFSGNVLIESVRVLSLPERKNQNAVFFLKPLQERAELICHSKTELISELKGLEGKHEILSVTQYKELPVGPNYFKYFRSNQDIENSLDFFIASQSSLDPSLLFIFAKNISSFSIVNPSEGIKTSYLKLLDSKHHSGPDDKVLPTLISIGPNLIGAVDFDTAMRERFQSLLTHQNPRVVSNTIEAISTIEAQQGRDFQFEVRGTLSNRAEANELIANAKKKLNKDILNGIREMVLSRKKMHIASGLYALGEVTSYYYKNNLSHFRSYTEVKALVDIAKRYESDDNQIVANQAKRALDIYYNRVNEGAA